MQMARDLKNKKIVRHFLPFFYFSWGQIVYPNGSVTRIDINSEITLESANLEEFEVKIKIRGLYKALPGPN